MSRVAASTASRSHVRPFVAGWITFVVVQAAYLVDLPTWLFFVVLVAGIAVTWVTSMWPLALVIVYSLMDVSVRSGLSPYQGAASDETLWPVRIGVAVFAGAWLVIAYGPRQQRYPRSPFRLPDFGVLRGSLLPLAIVAVLVDAYRYRNTGIPLFAGNVDALRGVLREDSSLIIGLLREAWTLGALIAILVVLIARHRRPLDFFWAAFFAVGAFSGGSRNALLIAVVPPLLAGFIYLRARKSPVSSRQRSIRLTAFGAGIAGIGVAAAGLMYYAGQRVLNGTGQFERDFQALYAGNPWGAAIGMTNLSLSSPLETWSRLYEFELSHVHDMTLNVFASVAFAVRPFGFEPDLYEVTAGLSAPYYMTVATFMGAPLRDFGIVGALVSALVLGVGIGLLDRLLQRRRQVFALLARGFLIYIAIFSVYEFQPFLYLSWLPVILGLYVLSRLRIPPLQLPGAFVRRVRARTQADSRA